MLIFLLYNRTFHRYNAFCWSTHCNFLAAASIGHSWAFSCFLLFSGLALCASPDTDIIAFIAPFIYTNVHNNAAHNNDNYYTRNHRLESFCSPCDPGGGDQLILGKPSDVQDVSTCIQSSLLLFMRMMIAFLFYTLLKLAPADIVNRNS